MVPCFQIHLIDKREIGILSHYTNFEKLNCSVASTPFEASITITAESAAIKFCMCLPRNPDVPEYPKC